MGFKSVAGCVEAMWGATCNQLEAMFWMILRSESSFSAKE
jgi:hypothetical protein